MTEITGATLIGWGYKPGDWFRAAIQAGETARQGGADEVAIREAVRAFEPAPAMPLRKIGALAHRLNIRPEGEDEIANVAAVERHMIELMRVPTVKAGAVMPDACPTGGGDGTIPVGGVIAAENAIHPGMHSADICCSMAITVLGDVDPTRVLDEGMKRSHFGGGGRPAGTQLQLPAEILKAIAENDFLKNETGSAVEHFGTQGDGNHFFYVGRLASTGQVALVTHHGSRRPGAMLYKAGMAVAEKYRQKLSPETGKHNAWIPAYTRDGERYWSALQTIRSWTKASHFAIHDLIVDAIDARPVDRFWNEHNFVFRKSDGLFYHAKGATPAWTDYAHDATGLTLIPLNMANPILIARGKNAENGLGFAPHGAGRNLSRTAYMKRHVGMTEEEIVASQTAGIDARFFCGIPDVSELPGAYKDASMVRAAIDEFGLAEIVDTVEPIGCIMAGDWERNAPWKMKRRAAAIEAEAQSDAP